MIRGGGGEAIYEEHFRQIEQAGGYRGMIGLGERGGRGVRVSYRAQGNIFGRLT